MMNEQKAFPIILVILAVIIGVALFKEFDFQSLRFKKVGIGIVYLITFAGLVIVIARSRRSKG
jgi:mitochondrial fission protein ELM1